MTPRHWTALALAVVGFVWLHALTVPQTLEDEDSVNLALGVESFNVAHYAPHPPGYPVYIAMGKASTALVGWVRPEWPRDRRAAAGLAWLSILAGGAGIVALAALWSGLGLPLRWAILAAVVTAATPLYWFTAARPLTDTPGLAAAVAVQAALLHGLNRVSTDSRWPRLLLLGAFGAGFAIGVRSQTMWMTLPLLAWVLGILVRDRRWRHAGGVALASLVGVLVWFVPMIQIMGGLSDYQSALAGQGRHDFSGVQMLATHPSWALLKEDLVQTFLTPWDVLAVPWIVLGLGVLGLVRLISDRRRAMTMLGLVTLPYLAFHLLFHEVETVRYTLPTVVMVAGFAVVALRWLGSAVGTVAAAGALVVCVIVSHPITALYAGGVPAFRVIEEVRTARAETTERPQIEAHHDAWWAVSRALDWNRAQWDLEAPRLVDRDESLRLVEYWRSGATTPIWFLSDPDRSDMARFDAGSALHQSTYLLPGGVRTLIGGLRQYDLGWWRLSAPGWMLGRGWALTPEMIGEQSDPHRAVAFLRRHTGDTMMFVGVRHLDTVGAPVELAAQLDGREVDRWTIDSGDAVTRWISLPAGSLRGSDAYATVTLSVVSTHPGHPERLLSFDQFDASAGPTPMLALGQGWSAREYAPEAPTHAWRRASRLSHVQVRHAGTAVRVTLRGDVPPNDFEVAPTIVIVAGETLLARFVPEPSFERSFEVSPEVLDAANGEVTIAVDLRRTPDERQRGVPYRDFGLRITGVAIATQGSH